MHWWHLPFSSPSKSESADDILIGSGKTRLFSLPRKSTENDVDEWRSESYSLPQQHSLSRLSSALPQPLPLPELQLRLPREPKFVSSRSHNVPLPAPGQSGGEREVERGRRRGLDEQLKRLVGKNTRRSVERTEFGLTRKSPLKQYARESYNTITPKSAPTSPYSSPVSSPQCSDTSTSYNTTPLGIFHAWLAPEMPHSNGNTGLSFNDKTALLLDDSPHTSPTLSSRVHVESLPGSVLPLPSMISSETPVSRRESNAQANVHTLPLPPGADMPSLPTSVSSNSATSDLLGATMSLPPTPISTLVARPELRGVKKPYSVSQEPMPIRSQWQKGKLIGRGTFGSVYVASNRETGALCAMKEVDILPEDIKSQESIRQLEQEIKVLSNLKHPNIVQYYGSEIAGDKFYIYLEYVHPGSINKFIHDHCAAITESVVRNFTRHILCGLAYLHSTKTIHRPR